MQKTISPYAAGLLRKDMGDNAFNTWIQKNGISPMQEQPMGLASLLTPDQQAMGEQPLQSAPGGPSASALASLLPQLPEQKQPGRGRANDILGSIFDAIGAIGGGEPNYWGNVLQQQQEDQKGRQALAERQAEREQSLADIIFREQIARNRPTNAQREYDWARTLPGMKDITYKDWVANYYRPQFFEQGGQRYQVTPSNSLPPGYDPNRYEVVE